MRVVVVDCDDILCIFRFAAFRRLFAHGVGYPALRILRQALLVPFEKAPAM